MNFICDNIAVNAEGNLTFAGQDTVALAEKYGTPLYLLDENKIREKCSCFLNAFRKYFPEGSLPLYASKANSFRQIYRIMSEMGLGIDVVSGGEIYTAEQAGFDLSKAYFHSNNKTDEEIGFAMDKNVGYFVVDHQSELEEIQKQAADHGILQKILLRVTPGIDPHTYEKVNTGMVDSKFGSAIETGQADSIVRSALTMKNISLRGFHCHVGSQVFEEDVFERTAAVMLDFCWDMYRKYGYETKELDLGGGFGVAYTEKQKSPDIDAKIKAIAGVVYATCEKYHMPCPVMHMEPGRSIVADAGMTLYTVGSVKKIISYRNYVSVDGGMTDNPRYALYGSEYTCCIANRMTEENRMECSLVGRCCESGDIIQPGIRLPETTAKGDIAAVCTTGAYNYSMASNYNRICRPAIVMLKDGDSYVAVRRETYADLCACDL